MGFAPHRSLGDNEMWQRQMPVCSLQLLCGCLDLSPLPSEDYSGPANGNWLQSAAAGRWCSWEGVRHCSPAANPASPSWQRCRVGMQGTCLPVAWDGGLFPRAVVLPSRMPAFTNVAALQGLGQAGLHKCLPGLQGPARCVLPVAVAEWLSCRGLLHAPT